MANAPINWYDPKVNKVISILKISIQTFKIPGVVR